MSRYSVWQDRQDEGARWESLPRMVSGRGKDSQGANKASLTRHLFTVRGAQEGPRLRLGEP